MASSACINDTVQTIGSRTTSLSLPLSDTTDASDTIDPADYINYKELLEETGVSTSLISIGCGMGDVGVSTKTVWVSSTAT
jgi:hypothetical protein